MARHPSAAAWVSPESWAAARRCRAHVPSAERPLTGLRARNLRRGRRGSFGDFSRQAASLPEAVGSAIRAVEVAVPGGRVVRIEPDDLVTASDIATRLNRSREGIRLLIAGQRGPGGFPAPAARLKSRTRLWRWSDVATWCADAAGIEPPAVQEAAFVAALNSALELRHLAPRLADPQERQEVKRVLSEDNLLLEASRQG